VVSTTLQRGKCWVNKSRNLVYFKCTCTTLALNDATANDDAIANDVTYDAAHDATHDGSISTYDVHAASRVTVHACNAKSRIYDGSISLPNVAPNSRHDAWIILDATLRYALSSETSWLLMN
jgi:hypothetical protein